MNGPIASGIGKLGLLPSCGLCYTRNDEGTFLSRKQVNVRLVAVTAVRFLTRHFAQDSQILKHLDRGGKQTPGLGWAYLAKQHG